VYRLDLICTWPRLKTEQNSDILLRCMITYWVCRFWVHSPFHLHIIVGIKVVGCHVVLVFIVRFDKLGPYWHFMLSYSTCTKIGCCILCGYHSLIEMLEYATKLNILMIGIILFLKNTFKAVCLYHKLRKTFATFYNRHFASLCSTCLCVVLRVCFVRTILSWCA